MAHFSPDNFFNSVHTLPLVASDQHNEARTGLKQSTYRAGGQAVVVPEPYLPFVDPRELRRTTPARDPVEGLTQHFGDLKLGHIQGTLNPQTMQMISYVRQARGRELTVPKIMDIALTTNASSSLSTGATGSDVPAPTTSQGTSQATTSRIEQGHRHVACARIDCQCEGIEEYHVDAYGRNGGGGGNRRASASLNGKMPKLDQPNRYPCKYCKNILALNNEDRTHWSIHSCSKYREDCYEKHDVVPDERQFLFKVNKDGSKTELALDDVAKKYGFIAHVRGMDWVNEHLAEWERRKRAAENAPAQPDPSIDAVWDPPPHSLPRNVAVTRVSDYNFAPPVLGPKVHHSVFSYGLNNSDDKIFDDGVDVAAGTKATKETAKKPYNRPPSPRPRGEVVIPRTAQGPQLRQAMESQPSQHQVRFSQQAPQPNSEPTEAAPAPKTRAPPTTTIKSSVKIRSGMSMRELVKQVYSDPKVTIPLGILAANWKGFHDESQRQLRRHVMPLSNANGGLNTASSEGYRVTNACLGEGVSAPQVLTRLEKEKPAYYSTPIGLAQALLGNAVVTTLIDTGAKVNLGGPRTKKILWEQYRDQAREPLPHKRLKDVSQGVSKFSVVFENIPVPLGGGAFFKQHTYCTLSTSFDLVPGQLSSRRLGLGPSTRRTTTAS